MMGKAGCPNKQVPFWSPEILRSTYTSTVVCFRRVPHAFYPYAIHHQEWASYFPGNFKFLWLYHQGFLTWQFEEPKVEDEASVLSWWRGESRWGLILRATLSVAAEAARMPAAQQSGHSTSRWGTKAQSMHWPREAEDFLPEPVGRLQGSFMFHYFHYSI